MADVRGPCRCHRPLPLEQFDDILARWVDAECRGDAATLDTLLDGEFRGDGPRGYVLTKDQWLDRHRSGDLRHLAFGWEDVHVRGHGDITVVMGVQAQVGTYRGEDCSGRFRATLVATQRAGRWAIVNLQLSELAAGAS